MVFVCYSVLTQEKHTLKKRNNKMKVTKIAIVAALIVAFSATPAANADEAGTIEFGISGASSAGIGF